ncbi:MAG TPA: hypothetical protein VGI41_02665 [Candidatus Udaeobacter sp.]|jgi:hypothetical protein
MIGQRIVVSSIIVFLYGMSSLAVGSDQQPIRPFDRYRAIFAVCVESLNVKWTGEARKYLLDEVKRRAEREKLIVSIDNNLDTKQFCDTHGFNTNEVIWLVMKFEDSDVEKGRVNFTLNAQNFIVQGAVFDPGISFKAAKSYLDRMLDGFFEYGEGKAHLSESIKRDERVIHSVALADRSARARTQ